MRLSCLAFKVSTAERLNTSTAQRLTLDFELVYPTPTTLSLSGVTLLSEDSEVEDSEQIFISSESLSLSGTTLVSSDYKLHLVDITEAELFVIRSLMLKDLYPPSELLNVPQFPPVPALFLRALLSMLVSVEENQSTPQQLNTSTPQQLNSSTPPSARKPTLQPLNASAPEVATLRSETFTQLQRIFSGDPEFSTRFLHSQPSISLPLLRRLCPVTSSSSPLELLVLRQVHGSSLGSSERDFLLGSLQNHLEIGDLSTVTREASRHIRLGTLKTSEVKRALQEPLNGAKAEEALQWAVCRYVAEGESPLFGLVLETAVDSGLTPGVLYTLGLLIEEEASGVEALRGCGVEPLRAPQPQRCVISSILRFFRRTRPSFFDSKEFYMILDFVGRRGSYKAIQESLYHFGGLSSGERLDRTSLVYALGFILSIFERNRNQKGFLKGDEVEFLSNRFECIVGGVLCRDDGILGVYRTKIRTEIDTYRREGIVEATSEDEQSSYSKKE